MLRNILLVGFVSAASAFMAPVSLRGTPALPSARASSTAIKMVDADTVLLALPGLAALGVSLQNRNFGGDMSAAQAVVAMPEPKTMQKVDIALARANFKRWNDSLQTKDPKMVAKMYNGGELSFLPTVSPMHIKDGSNTEEYFVAFVQKNPFGTITDDSIQVYGNGDAYLHSGMYTFELGTGADRAPVQARFSYVWKNVDGEWKITHHHSSVRPAGPNMLQVARENFGKWNAALQTKNPKTVAQMYSTKDLSFLPTVSPEHIKDGESTEGYFTAFVQKNPFGTITDDSVTVFDDGASYLHSGMYTFELGTGADRKPVQARFSYVWRKFGSDWKITHHHSSVRP